MQAPGSDNTTTTVSYHLVELQVEAMQKQLSLPHYLNTLLSHCIAFQATKARAWRVKVKRLKKIKLLLNLLVLVFW